MGRNQATRSAAQLVAVALSVMFMFAACSSNDAAETDVGSADAIAAVVAWQVGEQEPVLDDNGAEQLPVIFVVAADGATIDVGVQADVTAATIEWATVRFADQVADTFDPDLDGEPVRNDGALLLLGPMPDPANSIELDLVRYSAVDDGEAFTLEITSNPTTTDTEKFAPRAAVTSVTQP